MDKQSATKIAGKYFKNHTVDTLHVTADEQAFFNKTDAENHAKGLAEKDVFTVTRKEAEAPAKAEKPAEEKK